MPRKTKEEKELENKAKMENVINTMAPSYKLKLCCHHKDMPEICEIIDLPFQPRNGDIICIKPPNDPNEYARLTFPVHDLIYDATTRIFTMRPDVVQHMRNQQKQQSELSNVVDPLGA